MSRDKAKKPRKNGHVRSYVDVQTNPIDDDGTTAVQNQILNHLLNYHNSCIKCNLNTLLGRSVPEKTINPLEVFSNTSSYSSPEVNDPGIKYIDKSYEGPRPV